MMNEDEYQKQQDHWRELAEQLGLPAGNGTESVPPPAQPGQRPIPQDHGGAGDRGDPDNLEHDAVEAAPEGKRKPGRKANASPRGHTRRIEPREQAEVQPSRADDQHARAPRGRGRPRGRKSDGPEQSPVEHDVEKQMEEVFADPEKEEIDTLSDWNVPSWAEIISSLYRPER
jgi:hypothetical protein